jgi:hypothetical protein
MSTTNVPSCLAERKRSPVSPRRSPTSLTDARLAAQQEQAAVTGAHVVQSGAEFRQLALSADKRIMQPYGVMKSSWTLH